VGIFHSRADGAVQKLTCALIVEFAAQSAQYRVLGAKFFDL
jgi:hypothetical protein